MLEAFEAARTVARPVVLVFTAVGDEVGAPPNLMSLYPFDETTNSYDIQ